MNPYLIIGFLIALMAVGIGGYKHGYSTADHEVTVKWQQREAQQKDQYAAEKDRLVADHRAKEQKLAGDVAAVEQQRLEEADKHEKVKNDLLDAIRKHARVLRDPFTAANASGGSAGSAATPGASGGAASSGTELSFQTAEFLVNLASEADTVVAQLSACQRILIKERQVLSRPPG